MRIFSGIQPTGSKHFGNYSGGFRQYVATSREGEGFFCVVDLHSLSVPYDPVEFRDRCLDLAAMLIATGLDTERSTVFIQSHVSAHAEANWLLSAVATVGELRRMTQFKEKSKGQESVSAALFAYPVLMAGDILLYQTDVVPVGDDQRQHIELARDLAARFNARFGETFKLPGGIYPEEGARIMDLQDPEKKMSTTGGTALGTLYMLDSPEEITRKVKAAVTDTGREIVRAPDKAGVSNLVEIMAVATGTSPAAVEQQYAGQGYGKFKQDVAEAVVALLEPIRERYLKLRGDPAELERLMARGAEKARATSEPTLRQMYDRMGFVPRVRD
ncbi:MAG: tryptophan--tRNA ligase [Chloroflexota bacterium]